MTTIDELVGQTIISVSGLEKDSEMVLFRTQEGNTYKMYHEQDCCESVQINDVEGGTEDIVGGLVISAEEVVGESVESNSQGSRHLWTFYKIDTNKGGVWIRWLGESNGYYSESVDFTKVHPNED